MYQHLPHPVKSILIQKGFNVTSLHLVAHEVNTPPAPSPRLCWAAGWDAYVRRRPYTAMVDEHMRRGWLAANAAEAGMLTPGYAEEAGY